MEGHGAMIVCSRWSIYMTALPRRSGPRESCSAVSLDDGRRPDGLLGVMPPIPFLLLTLPSLTLPAPALIALLSVLPPFPFFRALMAAAFALTATGTTAA